MPCLLFGNKTYIYNNRGFLTQENDTTYQYDSNGNITRIGNKVLTYDSNIKDRLNSYDGKTITYHSNNPFLPKLYDGKEFTFEGNRLVRIDRSISSDEEESIFYTYDEKGRRIQKQISHYYNDDRDSYDEITKYYYSGDRLITQISDDNRLDFIYDENGFLIGFIKDKTYKYFYVRDILNNILGIIDKNGNLVVKYNYDAYGNNLGISGTLASSIGQLNPFRYKGYYYDSETNYFYCKARYYNPEFCRLIILDGIEYLNLCNINELNAFLYDKNNPILQFYSEFAPTILMLGKGHQGNMKSTKYIYWTDEELLARLKELNRKGRLTVEEKQEKKEIETELKARGQRNKTKRKGYNHS